MFQRKRKLSDISNKLTETEQKKRTYEEQIKKMKVGREECVRCIKMYNLLCLL